MKNYFFIVVVLSFCLFTPPSWAMNDDGDDSQSETSQPEDETSNIFFLHIANPDAARIYEHVVQKSNFFERESDPEADNFIKNAGIHVLCTTMKSALGQFGAKQQLISIFSGSKIIKLTTGEAQSVNAVVAHLQKSVFIDHLFTDPAELSHYRPTISRCSPIAALATSLANAARRNGRSDAPYELQFERLLAGETCAATKTVSSVNTQTQDTNSVEHE